MYQSTRKKYLLAGGFTLVELLIAIAVIGSISLVGVRILYDIVTVRAKQQTIEDTSDNLRVVARLITREVVEAHEVTVVDTHQMQIIGSDTCQTIKFDPDSGLVLHSVALSPCAPPDTGFSSITSDDLRIVDFAFSPVGEELIVVTLEMEGVYKNSLGDHPVRYKTTMSPRVSI